MGLLISNSPNPPKIDGTTGKRIDYPVSQLISGTFFNLGLVGTAVNSTGNRNTSRINYIPVQNSAFIQLVFGNYMATGSTEVPGPCNITVSADLEYITGSGVTSETGSRIRVTFGGNKQAKVDSASLLISDLIPFNVIAGQPFMVRTYWELPGLGYVGIYGKTVQGGTAQGGINNGEGSGANLNVLDTGTVTQAWTRSQYGPSAIIGYSQTYIPSVGIIGDSISTGYFDGGIDYFGGGYLYRAFSGQTGALSQTYPVTPIVPFVLTGISGETLGSWIVQANSYRRRHLAELCSTIICNYGINDVTGGVPLATIKANYLAEANQWINRGKNFVGCTLTPHTTSTDMWQTAINQTVTANEAVRTGFNSWMRDTSVAGFVAQTANPSLATIFDGAAAIEVNSSNVLTLNGGFWAVGGPVVDSGTSTTATAGAITDTTKTWTVDQYRGYVLGMTSGSASGISSPIASNSTTALTLANPQLTITPTAGDTYQIYSPNSGDGLHPASPGCVAISATMNVNALVR
jgi:hypothetical protein